MADVKCIATRESYGNALKELAENGADNLVVLDADLSAEGEHPGKEGRAGRGVRRDGRADEALQGAGADQEGPTRGGA